MRNVDWIKLKLNQKMINLKPAQVNGNANLSSSSENLVQKTQNNIINNMQRQFINPEQVRMNNLASIDRAVYIKNLLNLPKNMSDLLVFLQDDGKNTNIKTLKEQSNNRNNTIEKQNTNPNNINKESKQIIQNNIEKKQQSDNNFKQNLQINSNRKNHQKISKYNINEQSQQKNEQLNNNVKNNLQIKNNLKNLKQINQYNRNEQIQQKNEQLNNLKNNSLYNNNINFKNSTENNITYRNIIQHSPKTIQPKFQSKIQPNIEQEIEQNENIIENDIPEFTSEESVKGQNKTIPKFSHNIDLNNVALFLQKNSKVAMNKMISMMALATSQGITDTKPLQDTINIISSSISSNSNTTSAQTLKNLMLLYLPWLPLQEGVGFNLEIEQDEEIPDSETFVKVMITTVNFGNLSATVSLITANSVDISITCSSSFPKKELFKKLSNAGTEYSMQTVIDFKNQKNQLEQDIINPKAKVNLSNTAQINPYLLLMVHSLIRYTIEIDNIQSSGG
ncbi:hypothetical protein IJG72_08385 [bacterium]|nr:hypothetical protein [bacterium]